MQESDILEYGYYNPARFSMNVMYIFAVCLCVNNYIFIGLLNI